MSKFDAKTFITELPLYRSKPATLGMVRELTRFSGHIELYCSGCKEQSIFHPGCTANNRRSTLIGGVGVGLPLYPNQIDEPPHDMLFSLYFRCSRSLENGGMGHSAVFNFVCSAGRITKIGQFPSQAEQDLAESNQYRKILGDDLQREYSRAIGLHAHGIGVGAYVYLRRIFESLVHNAAKQKAVDDPGWSLDDWSQLRMEDKIKSLRSELPPLMSSNSAVYGLLSAGIHSWTEEECIDSFDILNIYIQAIINQKQRQMERLELERRAQKELNELAKKYRP